MNQTPVQDHLDEKQFLLSVSQLSESLSFGSEVSVFLGSGVDYAQSRLYQPGDPVKSIDWRVTGRTGKIYVREFETLKQMPVYLVLDASGSMLASSQTLSKYAWAVLIGGALALCAINHQMPVALFSSGESFDGRNLRFVPSLSRAQVHQWLHLLRQGPKFTAAPNSLCGTLRDISMSVHEKSLMIVLSDLHEQNAEYQLKQLAQQHDVMVLRLQDPAERNIHGGGIFRAKEAETGHSFLAGFKKNFGGHHAILQDLRRAGIDAITLDTAQEFLPGLRAFLQNRSSSGRVL